MFSKYRVKNLCFSCGSDITLNRFLLGLPCYRCEENDELIHHALKPPGPYERLVSRYRALMGTEPMNVWRPWVYAILNSESIAIPYLRRYKPLEFSLWVTGAYRGPGVIGVPEDEMDTVLNSPLLKDKSPILQGKPSEGYIRVLTDPQEVSRWDFKNYNPIIVWHLEKQPILRDAVHWGAIVINILNDYPSVFLPSFEVSAPEDKTAFPLPVKRVRLNQLPDNPEPLKELIYMLLPYLPDEFRPQFRALSDRADVPNTILQRLKDLLRESLLSSTISNRLKGVGILHEDSLRVPDIASVIKVLKEYSSPENRKSIKFVCDRELLRLLDRAFHLSGHTWRSQQQVHELKDISTLLVLPEWGPPIRDLGFATNISRRAAGFVVHESIGTIGPVTILRLGNIFQIRGTTINYDDNVMQNLKRLIRRYPRLTIIADTEFLVQGILLSALARPYSRPRLFRANDLYSGEFSPIHDEDSHRILASILEKYKEGISVQTSIRQKLDIHLPDPRLYKVLRMVKRKLEKPPVKVVKLRLNGIHQKFEVPEEADVINLRPGEIKVSTEILESNLIPPDPITTAPLIDAVADIPIKERLTALKTLYEKGLVTYPYENTKCRGFLAEVLKRYIGFVFGDEFVAETDEKRGILPTRPISPADLWTLTSIFAVQRPETRLYELIFRRAVASLMKSVRVRVASITIRFRGIENNFTLPINILEPGFNLMLPIELIRLSPVDKFTVTGVDVIDRFPVLTMGELIELLYREMPDIDPLRSLWHLRPYLKIGEHGVSLKSEYYRGIE